MISESDGGGIEGGRAGGAHRAGDRTWPRRAGTTGAQLGTMDSQVRPPERGQARPPRRGAGLALVTATAAAMASAGAAPRAAADVIAKWDFNSQSLAPSEGVGSLAPVGGVTGATFAQAAGSSDPLQPGLGWQTSGYPSQGSGSGSAGIEIRVDTLDYEAITVRWDQRHSNTSSRWVQFLCSTDGGGTFAALDLFEATAGETWFNARTVDLGAIPGVAGNAEAIFRIVSVFAPGSGAYQAAGQSSNYSGGTWRFDMIVVEGIPNAVPAPAATALLGLAALAGRRRRRCE